jgi:hypothetical protein
VLISTSQVFRCLGQNARCFFSLCLFAAAYLGYPPWFIGDRPLNFTGHPDRSHETLYPLPSSAFQLQFTRLPICSVRDTEAGCYDFRIERA